MARLEKMLGRSMGPLSAEDLARAQPTLGGLIRDSRAELEAFRTAHQGKYDARAMAKEAELQRSTALWDAVADAAERGNYWLGYEHPTRRPQNTATACFQELSVTSDGKPATALFIVDTTSGSGINYLRIAALVDERARLWYEDAAYRFNSLSDQERAALHRRYKEATAPGASERLPDDLAAAFPFGVYVDEATMMMRVR